MWLTYELVKLQEIENIETLTALEELWLGKNKITEIKVREHLLPRPSIPPLEDCMGIHGTDIGVQNISTLSNLKILSIQSNRLSSISGLSDLANLEELYISDNTLTDLSGLESNGNLRVLDFSNNQVSSLEHLSHLSHLEELWGSNNKLASFEEVERELRGKEELKTVYFEGNPLQRIGPAVYRNKVRLALPQIVQIDASKSLYSPNSPYLSVHCRTAHTYISLGLSNM